MTRARAASAAALAGRGIRIFAPVLEVGGVPARALELKAGRGYLLLVAFLVAFRADVQHGVAEFLQMVLFKTAGIASARSSPD